MNRSGCGFVGSRVMLRTDERTAMAEDVTRTEPTTTLDRRRMLLGAGAAGVAGVLAACGGDGETATTTGQGEPEDSASPDGGAPEQPTEQPTEEPTEPEDTGEGDQEAEATPGGDPLVASGDVPVGGGVIVSGEGVVVTQPTDGEFRGFSSTCTHQGCTVGDVSDGLIRCPCHGSRYFIEDGTVENGPATEPLPEVAVTVAEGQILRA